MSQPSQLMGYRSHNTKLRGKPREPNVELTTLGDDQSAFDEITLQNGEGTQVKLCFSRTYFDLDDTEVPPPSEFAEPRLGRAEIWLGITMDGVTRVGPKESEALWFRLADNKAAKVQWTVTRSDYEHGSKVLPSRAEHKYTAELFKDGTLVCKHEDRHYLVSIQIDTHGKACSLK